MEEQMQAVAQHTLDWSLLWSQADVFVKVLACVLLVMSITTWTLVVESLRRRRVARPISGAPTSTESKPGVSSVPFAGSSSVLGGIASIAPFVGLLGTVWGIMHTLIALGSNTQLSFQMIAAPLGEALVMTAAGLFVAIPAAAANRWLLHRHEAHRHSVLQALQSSIAIPTSAKGDVQ